MTSTTRIAAEAEGRPLSSTSGAPRNELIDFMRGALILLVVFGHSVQFNMYNGSDGYWNDGVWKLVYMFHMPMFMLISGYVSYLSASRKAPIDVTKARLLQLVIPMVIWSVVLTVVMAVANRLTGVPVAVGPMVFDTIRSSAIGFWFLTALLFSTFVVLVLRQFRLDRPIILLVAAVAVALVPVDKGIVCLTQYTFPFFCTGWALSSSDAIRRLDRRALYAVAVLLVPASILCFHLWNSQTYIYVSRMVIVDFGSVETILFRYAAGAIVGALFLFLVWQAYRFIKLPILAEFGKASLAIYLVQTVVMAITIRFAVDIGLPTAIAYLAHAVIAIAICYAVMQVSRRLPATSPMAAFLLFGAPSPFGARKPRMGDRAGLEGRS